MRSGTPRKSRRLPDGPPSGSRCIHPDGADEAVRIGRPCRRGLDTKRIDFSFLAFCRDYLLREFIVPPAYTGKAVMSGMSGGYRGWAYVVEVTPENGGFGATLTIVRAPGGDDSHGAEELMRRLDRPRPTARLAERDAGELVVAVIDRMADAGAPQPIPHVTADEIIARVRAAGLPGIGDRLQEYLGKPASSYAMGYQRGLEDIAPPPEIDPPLYLRGYADGQAAYPELLAAGLLSVRWRDRGHLRDLIQPVHDRTMLTDGDEFAEYRLDRLRKTIQPVFEPGSEPAEVERVDTYLQATVLLRERPLPGGWLRSRHPQAVATVHDHRRTRRFSLPIATQDPLERPARREAALRLVEGRLELTIDYGRPDDTARPEYADPAVVLAEARRLARTAVAVLEQWRRVEPDGFVRDPVTTSLQWRAAALRDLQTQGPTQTPELTDTQVARLGTQGPAARDSVHAWNVKARRGYEHQVAELPRLQARIRERGADPLDAAGWESFPSASARREPTPITQVGRGPAMAPEVADEVQLHEIRRVVEGLAPGEFAVRQRSPGLIEVRPLHPEPVIHEATLMAVHAQVPILYQRLMRALNVAASRWQVRPWDVTSPGAPAGLPRMVGHASIRWAVELDPDVPFRPAGPLAPPGYRRREELIHLVVRLAPPGHRVPAEWEC